MRLLLKLGSKKPIKSYQHSHVAMFLCYSFHWLAGVYGNCTLIEMIVAALRNGKNHMLRIFRTVFAAKLAAKAIAVTGSSRPK
jgi:hypothetical protein